MFGSKNPVSAYTQVSIDSAVQSADPHRLILLLFQGAESAVSLARESIRQGNLFSKAQALSKAIDIISNGLLASLDAENGGDLAVKLAALYEYMSTRLLHANLKNDVLALDEVAILLAEIRGAWEEITPNQQGF
jgi:flagellar secretion chaperone FliS